MFPLALGKLFLAVSRFTKRSDRVGVTAIIAAAGNSARMQGLGDKVLLPLLGQPLIVHTLQPFCRSDAINEIVIVTSGRLISALEQIVADYHLDKISAIVEGGRTRQESVARGLASLSPGCELVAIHDGARPCLSSDGLQSVIDAAFRHGAAILAVPAKDTVKLVRDGFEVSTPDRSELFLAQTPQVFRRQWIDDAHRRASQLGAVATDDAALVTAWGGSVAVVSGSYTNIKVTTPEDMMLAELFLSRR